MIRTLFYIIFLFSLIISGFTMRRAAADFPRGSCCAALKHQEKFIRQMQKRLPLFRFYLRAPQKRFAKKIFPMPAPLRRGVQNLISFCSAPIMRITRLRCRLRSLPRRFCTAQAPFSRRSKPPLQSSAHAAPRKTQTAAHIASGIRSANAGQ